MRGCRNAMSASRSRSCERSLERAIDQARFVTAVRGGLMAETTPRRCADDFRPERPARSAAERLRAALDSAGQHSTLEERRAEAGDRRAAIASRRLVVNQDSGRIHLL